MVKSKMSIKKNSPKLVCILAAGIGSRMGEYTEVINKSLLPINYKSSLTKIIENFPNNTKFIIATGFKKENLQNFIKIIGNKRIKIVNVKKYAGPGSGPAYSLYACRKYLQKSFYFIPCDTLISKNFSKTDKSNWLGVGKIKKPYLDYCNFLVNEKLEITDIYDKIKPEKNSYHNFSGLGYVHDAKTFWKCYTKNSGIKNYELSIILKKFIKQKKTIIKKHFWEDIGTIEKYKFIKKKYEKYDFSKINEIIYFEKDKVIKFHTNKKDLINKYKKYLLNPSVFPSVKINNEFLYYDYVYGKNFYEKAEPIKFRRLLNWCDKKLWKKQIIENKISFLRACQKFYFDKTNSRLRLFMKNNNYKEDGFNYINNEKIPNVYQLIKKINFKKLYQGIPSYIHGDLQFDNIIITKNKDFKLIDWRSDFGGLINVGDLYYDLAKILGGILINYREIKKNNFYYKNNLNKIFFKLPSSKNKKLLLYELKKFCLKKKLDFKKIELMTALIFLNMSPMHKDPFDKILFCYAKTLINEKNDKN